MKELLLKWLVNGIALFVVVHLVAGVSADRWQSVLVGALVLGLLNAFLRPVLILLTLPVNIVTLGLFTLVVNGLIFFLAARLVSGLHVAGFGTALLAAIVFSIVSFLLNMLVGSKD